MMDQGLADEFAAVSLRYLQANPTAESIRQVLAGAVLAGYRLGIGSASQEVRKLADSARGDGPFPLRVTTYVAYYEAAEHLRLRAEGAGHANPRGLLQPYKLYPLPQPDGMLEAS